MELRNRTRRQVDGISDYEYGDSDDDLYVSFVTPSSRNSSLIYNNTNTSTMASGSLLDSVKNSDNYIFIEIAQVVIKPSEIQLSTQKLQGMVKSNLGLIFRKPSQICIVMVDENKEIAFDLDQVTKFRFSDVTGQKEILLDVKKGFKRDFYEFPLRSLDDRLQIPCDPSRGKLDDADTIIFKICKYVDNSLIVKLINNIKHWKSTNVKQPPQYNAENSQNSKNNIVNQEVNKKGSFIKPARDDHCDIRSNIGIIALDNDVNNGSQTHNKNHVNDNITDWINENKEKWTNNDKEKWTNNDKEKWTNNDKEKWTNNDKEKWKNDDKEKWKNGDKEKWKNDDKEKWTNDDISQASSSTITIQPEKGDALKASKNSHSDSELHITCIFITKKYAILVSFDIYLKQLTALIEERYNVKISMDRLYYLNHVGEKISLIDEEDWDVAKKEAMNAQTFRISLVVE